MVQYLLSRGAIALDNSPDVDYVTANLMDLDWFRITDGQDKEEIITVLEILTSYGWNINDPISKADDRRLVHYLISDKWESLFDRRQLLDFCLKAQFDFTGIANGMPILAFVMDANDELFMDFLLQHYLEVRFKVLIEQFFDSCLYLRRYLHQASRTGGKPSSMVLLETIIRAAANLDAFDEDSTLIRMVEKQVQELRDEPEAEREQWMETMATVTRILDGFHSLPTM